jgi:hypothetical protein
MKQLLVALGLVGLVAAVALAEPFTAPRDRSDTPIYTSVTAEPIGGGNLRDAPFPLYSNMTTTATLFPVTFAGGAVSVDDYNLFDGMNPPYPPMYKFQFIGGVAQAGQAVFFTLYNYTGMTTGSFGVQLPYAGGYAWSITSADGAPLSVPVRSQGYVQMWADDGSVLTPSTGIWYVNTDTPTVGTTGPTYPGLTHAGVYVNHKYSIHLPEPTTLLMFGLGALILARRRH